MVKRSRALAVSTAALFLLGGSAPLALPVVIDFDDRTGFLAQIAEGLPVPAQFLIDDEYANLGVVFDSPGGGLVVLAPDNPVTGMNSVAAAGPGPVVTYLEAITAEFQLFGTDATVDSVSLDLSTTSQFSTLHAYDLDGELLGSDSGAFSATLQVTFPGQIHSIELEQGPWGFDNFTFEGLTPIPEPGVGVLVATVLGCCSMRRRARR